MFFARQRKSRKAESTLSSNRPLQSNDFLDLIHTSLPFMSVQFHPESSPGPIDTDWVFDFFLKRAGLLKNKKK
ncbi:hypothetical protein K8Q98_00855 [Candidatus Nomurabacteria bacterium]|nr:hypothetical protein [Candidatus Nomurabacteria bacterium]